MDELPFTHGNAIDVLPDPIDERPLLALNRPIRSKIRDLDKWLMKTVHSSSVLIRSSNSGCRVP
jgi:hypothetical protein